MRRPRVEFGLRWLMAAVAVVALALTAYDWYARMRWFRAEYAIKSLSHWRRHRKTDWRSASDLWHDEMFRKYQNASFHPWLPVEPDPPCPE